MIAASLLVLACVAAATARDLCTYAEWGKINDRHSERVPLQPAELSPGIRDWTVKIPEINCPANGHVDGVWAEVCEVDSPPETHFIAENLLYVHRTGNLYYSAKVRITAYCRQYNNYDWPWSSKLGQNSPQYVGLQPY